jgi:hypothetical protein
VKKLDLVKSTLVIPTLEKFIIITGKSDYIVYEDYSQRILNEVKIDVVNNVQLECGH